MSIRPKSKIKIRPVPAMGAPVTDDRHLDQWTQNARERIEHLEDAQDAAAASITTLRTQTAPPPAVPPATPPDESDVGLVLAGMATRPPHGVPESAFGLPLAMLATRQPRVMDPLVMAFDLLSKIQALEQRVRDLETAVSLSLMS